MMLRLFFSVLCLTTGGVVASQAQWSTNGTHTYYNSGNVGIQANRRTTVPYGFIARRHVAGHNEVVLKRQNRK